jgi:hypothetical protein
MGGSLRLSFNSRPSEILTAGQKSSFKAKCWNHLQNWRAGESFLSRYQPRRKERLAVWPPPPPNCWCRPKGAAAAGWAENRQQRYSCSGYWYSADGRRAAGSPLWNSKYFVKPIIINFLRNTVPVPLLQVPVIESGLPITYTEFLKQNKKLR